MKFHAFLLLGIVGGSGCSSLTTPPGPMNVQQAAATIHDPFPLTDIGPDDLGSRPPDFQRPLPEPVRNRLHVDSGLAN